VSRFDPVGDALRRRREEGVCMYCGGKRREIKSLSPSQRRELVRPGDGAMACLNKKCGRGMGQARKKVRVKLQLPPGAES